MRLDKYLKVSRLIKRRTIANEACDSERVTVNGREAKASYQVKIGDVIEIAFGNRSLRVEVTDISENAKKAEAAAIPGTIRNRPLRKERAVSYNSRYMAAASAFFAFSLMSVTSTLRLRLPKAISITSPILTW